MNLRVHGKPLYNASMLWKHSLLWKALAVAAVSFAAAAAFSAYLQPGLLIEFANLVLCY